MPARDNHPLTFAIGHVQSKDVLRVIATIDELEDGGENRTWLMKWTKADAKWGRFVVRWPLSRMWVFEDGGAHVFAVGPEGHVALLNPKGSGEEWIDRADAGIISHGPIRDLRAVGGELFACGMGRQVYRRAPRSGWVHSDEGALLPLGKIQVTGFNAIGGTSVDHLLAAGFGGEIWRRDARSWRQLESPTNAVLYDLCVVDEQTAYAAGQKGVLLKGSGDSWEAIEQTATTDDIWSIAWFGGQLYAATSDALYRLADENLEEVRVKGASSFGHLHANDGVMLSTGTNDVIWTSDGKKWHHITP